MHCRDKNKTTHRLQIPHRFTHFGAGLDFYTHCYIVKINMAQRNAIRKTLMTYKIIKPNAIHTFTRYPASCLNMVFVTYMFFSGTGTFFFVLRLNKGNENTCGLFVQIHIFHYS